MARSFFSTLPQLELAGKGMPCHLWRAARWAGFCGGRADKKNRGKSRGFMSFTFDGEAQNEWFKPTVKPRTFPWLVLVGINAFLLRE